MRRIRAWCLPAIAAAGGLLAARGTTPRQRCDQPHYRWDVKVDTSLFTRAAVATTVTDILNRWAAPAIGPDDRCAPRSDRERNVYIVSGWIRRIETAKDDGDWHIELTDGPTSPVDSCIVVEIPLPALGAAYRRSRSQLRALLVGRQLDKQGDLDAPLLVRIVGAAFYDGQHRRTTRKRDQTDRGHGRCNASVRSLWELHPVYAVLRP